MIPNPYQTENWQRWVYRLQQTLNPVLTEVQSAFFRQGQALKLGSYVVADLPSAATPGCVIYVSDETGGAVLAFSDGTNWRRVTDRAVVS